MTVVEKEKIKNEEFAQANDISSNEMEEIYNKIFEELPDDLDEDKKVIRALRKTRGALRKQIQSGGNWEEGFIFMRFPNQEYNIYAWNQVDEYVKENGLDKAKEVGKVNAEGEYLHTAGFNKGEKIDKDAIIGNAIGLFTDDNSNVVAKWLRIGRYNIKDKIPLCQELNINVKEGTKPGPLFSNNKLMYYNGSRKMDSTFEPSSPDVMRHYEGIFKDLFGDIVFSDYADLESYLSDNISDKNNFACIHGICTQISPRSEVTDNIPVEFEFEDAVLLLWVKPYIFEGLAIEEGVAGILMVNAYQKDDGIGLNVGGFLQYEEE